MRIELRWILSFVLRNDHLGCIAQYTLPTSHAAARVLAQKPLEGPGRKMQVTAA